MKKPATRAGMEKEINVMISFEEIELVKGYNPA